MLPTEINDDIDRLLEEVSGRPDGPEDSRSEKPCSSAPVSASSWDLVDGNPVATDMSRQEVLIRSASLSLSEPKLKLPWEEGFWDNFFNPGTSLDMLLLEPPVHRPVPFAPPSAKDPALEPAAKKLKVDSVVPLFCQVVKDRALTSWQDKREAEHQRALKNGLSCLNPGTLRGMPKSRRS